MNPETVIAGLIGLITSIVPEPYAGKLQTAVRDYFAALGQQSADAEKTAAAKENAAAVVSEILPTVVDSPLPVTPAPAEPEPAAPPIAPTPIPAEPAPSSPSEPTQTAAEPVPEPIAPTPEPVAEPKPEPPKKNDGRNKAPVF